ncbi:hypothetical protein [Demequina sp.]|uniref:hypothetical protein n=1 Tax=Demequina sp. TaxID=2050685 RepID=UPI0025EB1931|nr:hypothetical protein [Demequina sp.]
MYPYSKALTSTVAAAGTGVLGSAVDVGLGVASDDGLVDVPSSDVPPQAVRASAATAAMTATLNRARVARAGVCDADM